MSVPTFLEVVRRRWWVIVVVTALAAGGAYGYSKVESRVYRATTTVLAIPAPDASTAQASSDLSLLSYGSLSGTFASIARARSTLQAAAAEIGLSPARVADYSVRTALLPQTTVLEISVDGPDPAVAIHLANRLSSNVSVAVGGYFQVISISRLDRAVPPAAVVVPRTSRNVLFGGIAGVIVGFVLAGFSLAVSSRTRV